MIDQGFKFDLCQKDRLPKFIFFQKSGGQRTHPSNLFLIDFQHRGIGWIQPWISICGFDRIGMNPEAPQYCGECSFHMKEIEIDLRLFPVLIRRASCTDDPKPIALNGDPIRPAPVYFAYLKKPDEPPVGHSGQGFGKFGLADAGRAFHQDGLGQSISQENHLGNPIVGQVTEPAKTQFDRGRALQSLHRHVRIWPSPNNTYRSEVSASRPIGPRT